GGRGQAAGQGERGVAPAPAPQAFGPADGPGLDGLALEEAAQVVGQGAGRGVAPGRLLGQGLEADGLQVARDLVVEPTRRPRLFLEDLPDHHGLRAAEGALAAEQLVEDDAEVVDVAAAVHLVAAAGRLFRTHVRRGA